MRTKRGIRGKGKEKPREGGRHVREKVCGRGARRGEQGEKKEEVKEEMRTKGHEREK